MPPEVAPVLTFRPDRLLFGIKRSSPMFHVDNRVKRSIALDLKQPRGLEIAYEMVAAADGFLTNMRLPSLEEMSGCWDCRATAPVRKFVALMPNRCRVTGGRPDPCRGGRGTRGRPRGLARWTFMVRRGVHAASPRSLVKIPKTVL